MPLDAMKMNGRYYFFRIGIGLDAQVIRETTRQAKRRFGRWAYLRSFLSRVSFHPKGHRYHCTMDGREHKFKAIQLFIANGGQIALVPFRIGPDISSNDGILNICAYDVHSWWHYFGRCLETVATRVSPAASPEVLDHPPEQSRFRRKTASPCCMVMEKHVRRRRSRIELLPNALRVTTAFELAGPFLI